MNYGFLFLLLSLGFSLIFLITYNINSLKKRNINKLFFIFSSTTLLISFSILIYYFIADHFEIIYVFNHSEKGQHLLYKISSLWAGQEGSLLLWTLFLNLLLIPIIFSKKDFYKDKKITNSLFIIFLYFLIISIFFANPFVEFSSTTSSDGQGLNPLLKNFWMLIHPPLLFLGYGLTSVIYSLSFSSLPLLKSDSRFKRLAALREIRKWSLLATGFMGAGIFLGGYWAYAVLGWGGFWGWDPVENSSLIPWLLLVALLHGIILEKKYSLFKKTNLILPLFILGSTLYSTYLTRSGSLSDFSVHSFGSSSISAPLALLLALVFVLFLLALLWQFKKKSSVDVKEPAMEETRRKTFGTELKENTLFYLVISIILLTGIIAIGTSMPILSGFFYDNSFSLNSSFYNSMIIPFAYLFTISYLLYFSIDLKIKKKKVYLICGFLISLLITLMMVGISSLVIFSLAYLFTCSIFLTGISFFENPPFKMGGKISHTGLFLFMLGALCSSSLEKSFKFEIAAGESINFSHYSFLFKKGDLTSNSGINFQLSDLSAKDKKTDFIIPYFFSKKTNSFYKEPYIKYGLLKDIYFSPGKLNKGVDRTGIYTLTKNKPVNLYGYTFELLKINMEENLKELSIKTSGRIKISKNSKSWLINSTRKDFLMDRSHRKINISSIPLSKRNFFIKSYNPESKSLIVKFNILDEDPMMEDSLFIDISFKRYTSLVWLGTLLIVTGIFISLLNRKRVNAHV